MISDTPTPRTAAAWLSEWKAHENSAGKSSPAHGMCDFAEQLERELSAAQAELAALKAELAARERQLSICEAVVDQHADTILKLREELARARDDEAREEKSCQK